ncbi:MAG TPA: hypothetical protein VFO34_17415 [Candidatus Acidoferrales bacterium]|nr:hypothetical protein [Candidatus Acidoferrales bacterium]
MGQKIFPKFPALSKAAKWTYGTAVLAGACTGLYFGFMMQWNALKLFEDGASAGPTAVVDFAYRQYWYADAAHARASLQTSERVLQRLRVLDASKDRDLSLLYVRSAILDDELSDTLQSKADLDAARKSYPHRGPNPGDAIFHTDEELKAAVKKLDAALTDRSPR